MYDNADAGTQLTLYSFLIPMLYCDAITDAMTKGLGQQKICVRYNILTSAMDVCFLYYLLPEYGMSGYFFSFALTHLVNFMLSLRRLLKITGQRIPFHIPILSLAATLAAIWGAAYFSAPVPRLVGFTALFGSLLCLFRVTGREDLRWLRGLLAQK